MHLLVQVFSIVGTEYLHETINPDQLEIPAYITEHDMTVRIMCSLDHPAYITEHGMTVRFMYSIH